jgi:ribosomal protein S18 acetylase RimI-like enzyme
MKSDFILREFKDEDYPSVLKLWELLGLGGVHRGDDLQIIRRTIDMGGQLLLLVEPGSSEIVGSSWLTIDGRRTYLHHFGIHTEYQGKGLADILLEASLKLAKSYGMQIKLEVHKDNVRALNLYVKTGFIYLGDYHVYIIRDISAI